MDLEDAPHPGPGEGEGRSGSCPATNATVLWAGAALLAANLALLVVTVAVHLNSVDIREQAERNLVLSREALRALR